ncbi:4-(cytidine 5'-diphospho)-2-C-methyl-D-erythritol kinase [Akkermansiaceae bacterium]|nr:4-(cytidine 5'-diphospho)-2-C-methyl-D-erythritol kinase [Akkermansiaceae bacterium]
MTVSAPAKINLSLRITDKRDDGFHELETLVLPIESLADELTFTESDQFSLRCTTPGVPTDESNLISRALRLFEKESGLACPYEIDLTKHTPHGAGLGGGSSDAAHTFLALNELTKADIPLDTLAEWAGRLGSDIPLFLYQAPCWCRGRGEIIEPTQLDWNRRILLLKPAFSIPTPWAYSRWKESRELPRVSYTEQTACDQILVNDLERPVFEKFQFLAELKQFLLERPETEAAMMSGSGSTVFAILKDNADAEGLLSSTLGELDATMWYHITPASDSR